MYSPFNSSGDIKQSKEFRSVEQETLSGYRPKGKTHYRFINGVRLASHYHGGTSPLDAGIPVSGVLKEQFKAIQWDKMKFTSANRAVDILAVGPGTKGFMLHVRPVEGSGSAWVYADSVEEGSNG